MSEKYKLVFLVRDASLRKALRKAISDDGKLSYSEVELIVSSTLDGKGVTYHEFKELRAILKTAKTLDMRSKLLIVDFLGKYKHYHHYLQYQNKKKKFNVPYIIDHIPSNTLHNRRPGHSMSPMYLTIHSTANLNSTAKNERKWLTNSTNNRTASYHLVVDQKEVVECIPLNESAWHAGDGSNGTGNRKTIGLEICESGDRTKTLENAIALTGKILRDKSWDVSKLKQHKDWSSKNCPRILINSGNRGKPHQTWEWFKKEVEKLL